jgi:hypothetical protein
VGGFTPHWKIELRPHHADDPAAAAVHGYRSANNAGIAVESPLSEPIAENQLGAGVGLLAFLDIPVPAWA